jgi:uncharacterized protein (TIGR03083 family)
MDFLAAIRRDSDRFYATADGADPARPVPACPDWTVADLVWHLAGVHWFWGSVVETRASEPDGLRQSHPERPTDYDDIVAWGRVQADRMIRILEATPDDVAAWTWAMEDRDHNVAFIRRHQVQEAAVHRWDIEDAATGRPQPIEPDVASDSIDEILAVTLPWDVDGDKPLPGSVHIHCTDTDGEWFVHPDGRVEPIHAKGDVAIRGTASDLLLGLYARIPATALDLIGDTSVAHALLTRLDNE